MTDHDDKRRFTRVPFDAELQVDVGGRHYPAELIDISLKGLLVQAPASWAVQMGDACIATLALGDEILIHMNCTLLHQHGNRAGLRIDRIDMESIMHLRRLLELNLGDPELFERELSGLGDD